jgi:ATP-binding cassette subfamily B (MDR/TAP) protein 8
MLSILHSSLAKPGAGKSTIAALLERFYDPTEGSGKVCAANHHGCAQHVPHVHSTSSKPSSVLLDGVDIREVDPQWLRWVEPLEATRFPFFAPIFTSPPVISILKNYRQDAIGYINQEPVLFATSVFENIRYGRPTASREEVYEAARMANAHQFISSFPEGESCETGRSALRCFGGRCPAAFRLF